METGKSGVVLESRPIRPYFIPMVLVGGAASLLVAWIVMVAVGVPVEELGPFATLLVLSGVISLAMAAYWALGASRARLTITDDQLRVRPAFGRQQSISLSRLASVDVRLVDGGKVQLLILTDAGGQSAEIAVGGWVNEAEIFRHVADTTTRTEATVSSAARAVIG
jgi:hypothetical protein